MMSCDVPAPSDQPLDGDARLIMGHRTRAWNEETREQCLCPNRNRIRTIVRFP